MGIQYILDLWGGCWGDHWDDIVHAEIGLTQSIMEDGYNVASMQHEYEGLDFRLEPSKLSCRGKLNPTVCCGMDGETLRGPVRPWHWMAQAQWPRTLPCSRWSQGEMLRAFDSALGL